MRLKRRGAWAGSSTTIERAVEWMCEADATNHGALETVGVSVEQTAELLGRLVSKLHETGRFSEEDVLAVINPSYGAGVFERASDDE